MDILNTNNLLRPQEVTNEDEQQMERERAKPREEQESIRVKRHKEQTGTIAEKYGKDRVTISEEGQDAYEIARNILTTQAPQAGQGVIAFGKKTHEKGEESFNKGDTSIFGFIKGIFGL
ncbi:hypothetical protein HY792_07700 [Candidatus Desantisbacteria bacterium]|nr:hypothetical protein [Candidatus Desantisbacteria bacterium]